MLGCMSTHWHKVLREVWGHKARTALVVLSMAAGVFGVGMMASTRLMLLRELNSAYMAITPAHAELQADPFDDDLLKAVRRIPGVVEVEGRPSLAARLLAADEEYVLGLEVVADYEHMRINHVQPLSGDWPPTAHRLLLERRSLDFLGLQVGDSLLILGACVALVKGSASEATYFVVFVVCPRMILSPTAWPWASRTGNRWPVPGRYMPTTTSNGPVGTSRGRETRTGSATTSPAAQRRVG
jgi:hypothetical protein